MSRVGEPRIQAKVAQLHGHNLAEVSAPCAPAYAGTVGSIDEFLAGLDDPTRAALGRVRDLALEVAPTAEQGAGYGMPALVLAGRPLLAFAVARRHLALYPFSPAAVDAVRDRLDAAQVSKGTVRFSVAAPLAADVVRDLVTHRADEIIRGSR